MLASYVQQIEDKEERNKKAQTLVELMRNINPSLKDTGEYYQKIWDHLFLITDLELDVESPYPKPAANSIMRGEPKPLDYNNNELSFRHYGRNTELLIKSAIEKEDKEEQFDSITYIGRLMKKFYSAWNGESVDNAVIAGHIKRLSNGKLNVDLERINQKNAWDLNSATGSRNNQSKFKSGAKKVSNDSRSGVHNKKKRNFNNPKK